MTILEYVVNWVEFELWLMSLKRALVKSAGSLMGILYGDFWENSDQIWWIVDAGISL